MLVISSCWAISTPASLRALKIEITRKLKIVDSGSSTATKKRKLTDHSLAKYTEPVAQVFWKYPNCAASKMVVFKLLFEAARH